MKFVHVRPTDQITLRPYAGSSVSEVTQEMIELAKRWNCTIRVSFNGVILLATPGRSSQEIVNYYTEQINNLSLRYTKELRCVSNNLESLKGCPTKTTSFRYSGTNEIQSLKGCPTKEEK